MKYILLTLTILQGLTSIGQYNQPVLVERPLDFEYLTVPDSMGERILSKTAVILNSANKNQTGDIKLPYPIIFIHGLNSNAETFVPTTYNFLTPQYGLKNGGRFDYCLNYDGNNTIANTNFYNTPGADIAVFQGNWIPGDFYYVNFDTGINGSFIPGSSSVQVESNQSAVVKQGAALRDAIYRVLQITGRDKVILFGHSMGGLAAREYLQNSYLWMPDGDHHVAKLVTTGTPHGGSNASFSYLNTIFLNVNNRSEAVRDLRESYFYSGSPGVYLFGGVESNSVCNDMLLYNFNNVDVNCNGYFGNSVVGLNSKPLYNNLDYACIIGTANSLNGGDYVVDDQNANLANYYNLPSPRNIFLVSSSHTNLPSQTYVNMQGIDEPNEYSLAYDIYYDITYTGFITMQPAGGYIYDYDKYKFNVPGNNAVTVNISNINVPNLVTRIVETNTNNIVATYQSNGSSSITFTQTLSPGDYYLDIYSSPTSSSYLTPYNFIISNSGPQIGIAELSDKLKSISIYPNPTKNNLTVEVANLESNLNIEILNTIGQTVYTSILSANKTVIDVNRLPSGVYLIKISEGDLFVNKKFVKE